MFHKHAFEFNCSYNIHEGIGKIFLEKTITEYELNTKELAALILTKV